MNKKNFFSGAVFFTLLPHLCYSLPENAYVKSGSAEIHRTDSHTMEIRPSDQAILHYSKFNPDLSDFRE